MRLCSAGVALAMIAGSASAGFSSDLSLFVFEEYTSSSEVEGRAIVGGSLNGPASNYATKLNAGAYAGVDTLWVGEYVFAGNVQLQAGNARVGGKVAGNINFNGGGSLVSDPGVVSDINILRNTMVSASSAFAAMSATGSVSLPGSQPSSVTFTATPGAGGVSVINIAAWELFSNNNVQTINLDLAGADTLIINVSGSFADFSTGGNFASSFANDNARSRVLWNFFEAEIVNLRGKAFEGAILAPGAFVDHEGVISGLVVAESMHSKSEVHLPGFKGIIPAPGVAATLGLAGIMAARRRRAS